MGDGKQGKAENEKKRKRSSLVDLSSDEGEEEEDSLTTSSPAPPPPPLLKHKTSLSKPPDVKCELPMEQESRFESSISNQQPDPESMTQNSSIHSGQELEDDELDLFQHCGVTGENNHHLLHPGPSRITAEELHSSGQGNCKVIEVTIFAGANKVVRVDDVGYVYVRQLRELERAVKIHF